jgi:hypothetical protein
VGDIYLAGGLEAGSRLSSEEDGLSADDREQCVRAALALSAYLGWDITGFSWKELVALGKPLAFSWWERAQGQEEMACEQAPQEREFRGGQDGLQVRLDDGVVLTVAAYERAFQVGEMARAEEEWEWSPEGAMALLQREMLLALQLCIFRTFGLPMYQAFLAHTAASAAVGEPGSKTQSAAGQPGSSVEDGHAEVSLASYTQLCGALDPRLYRVKWLPGSEGQGCSIEVESLLSGTVFTYEREAQVEELLAELSAQMADDGEAAASPHA